jgi:hypothetical protein
MNLNFIAYTGKSKARESRTEEKIIFTNPAR